MERSARYDGLADWYEERLGPFTRSHEGVVRRLLGPGPGRCLDLGCGGGAHLPTLLDLGWDVTGVDLSSDQLRVAREQLGNRAELLQADAAELPFLDASFDAVASIFVHTDVEDYSAVLAEAARVLRPRRRLVHLGLHPCFTGPHSRYRGPDEPPELLPGYRDTSWTDDAAGFGEGLRRRVGQTHLPLAELLNALLGADFELECFEEPGELDYPRVLAVAAKRR
jgi:SAM-dependent methyltransferase